MSDIKTKSQKNKIDDEKRKSSLKEKIKAKQTQQNLIKNALLNIDQAGSTNKLKFESDDDDDDDDIPGNEAGIDEGKLVLFDESNDENEEDYDLGVKEQFKGKEGLKLLTLQSTYGNDDRFKIDKRFMENEDEEDNNTKSKEDDGVVVEESDKVCTEEEKNRQLQILGDVLGQPIALNETLKKNKKRTFDMVRYDASNEEHSKFLIRTEENEPEVKKKKEKKKSAEASLPSKPVSKDKFYKVSSSIKQAFETAKSGFSLLQTFGRSKSDDEDERESHKQIEKIENVKKNYVSLLNNKEEDSTSDEDASPDEDVSIRDDDKISVDSIEPKKSLINKVDRPYVKKDVNAQGVWKESFFFQLDDPRFKEGLDFINKKNSNEAKAAQETFDKDRGKLREVYRTHLKKHMQKNNPFKKKVGGMKIKQSKFMKSKRTNGRPRAMYKK